MLNNSYENCELIDLIPSAALTLFVFQLAYPSENRNMQKIDSKVKDDPNVKQSQPVEMDYNKLYQKVKYSRGHLNPNSYMGSKSSKASTFTVTNAPPQPRGFNQEQWRNTENRMLGL